ncbi:RING/U-box superfamily protein with ARM repeat domain-containing protein [Actinidia rufa]|uniref:RING-type E3 ubiquitin transferase n=1 Tax=Actinidia rufa TaxID=165716 RepID=A0A7J0E3F4_9ERIC|nr:RING/U-box superfamily protein with ARM repeat domain-containing protein [Actinidia rufa]
MEISLLKVLLNNISSVFRLSSHDNIADEPAQKYYIKVEEILKLLKPVLDAIFDADIASEELLQKSFGELGHSVNELRELFGNWHLLRSKIYFVLQVETLISKIRASSVEIFELLISSDQCLPVELNASSLELYAQKIKQMGSEQISAIIRKASREQVHGSGPRSESLEQFADCLSLRSNQELLIEAVALEKLKENAEQAEKRIAKPRQTYERAFIRKWIDLGLIVCPKTRQTLAHTTLIPNYYVKAVIASWCESNNVKLPDPMKLSLKKPPPLARAENIASKDPHIIPQSSSSQPICKWEWVGYSDIVGKKCDNRLANSGEQGLESGKPTPHFTIKNRTFSSGSGDDERLSRGHNRTASASSTHSSPNILQGMSADGNEKSSPVASYNSDNSGELTSETQAATALTTPQREPAFSPRLETKSQSQMMWQHSPDRFVSRIVSSPANETRADLSGVEIQVRKLVEGLKGTSIDVQRVATAELRLLAKCMENRIVIASCGGIKLLVSLLLSTDAEIQENAVTALLNLSINDDNKIAIGNANAIEPLIHVLKTGSPKAKENSAATLFSLSVIEDNKVRIGRSGAIEPLVELLGNGTPLGKKDAATALFNLSLFHENKLRIVEAGAVKYLVELTDPSAGMVDKAVAVLANLATIQDGKAAIGQEGGIPVLVEVVELGSARVKENAAAALLQLCSNSNRYCSMVLQEGGVPPLVVLSQSGTPRAKERVMTLGSVVWGCF